MLPSIPHVLKYLEEVIDKEGKDRATEKRGFHHNPSSATMVSDDGHIVGACLRQLYYRATELPPSNGRGFSSKLTAAFGQAIHDYATGKLQKHPNLTVDPEVPGKVVVDPLTREVSYRIDARLAHRGERGGLEIKTKNGFDLQRSLKDRGPYESDLAQVVTCFEIDDTLMWYVLVYFARDTGYCAEYHLWREKIDGKIVMKMKGVLPEKNTKILADITFDKIKARWGELDKFIETKTLPPRDFKAVLKEDGTVTKMRQKNGEKFKTDARCLYCSWQTHCWTLPDAKEDAKKLEI